MARRSQPYRLEWPHSAEQQEHIDEMFQLLFDDTDNGSIEVSADQITEGILGVTRGGTGLDEFVIGDLLFASDTDELDTLADVVTGNALISGGVGVAPSWGKIGLTTHVSGTLTVAFGGTGITTYAVGDILSANTASTLSKISAVAAGSYLRAAGVATLPVWSTLTLPNASAQGDIFISTTANAMTVLAKNTTATRYLANTGASNNPAWDQVNLANGVTGTLPVANGGTNAGAFTQGSIVFAGASGTYTQDNANFFWDNGNDRLGLGTATPLSRLHINGQSAWIIQDEQDTDPTTTELDSLDSIAIYNKNNKFVLAYNNAGTITYISIPLDGSTTTWTHNTTAP